MEPDLLLPGAAECAQAIGREVRINELQPVVNELLAANTRMRRDHGLYGVTDLFVRKIRREHGAYPLPAQRPLLGHCDSLLSPAMQRSQPHSFLMMLGVVLALATPSVCLARPNPGGLGGPASGAGVAPGAGFGAAGAGLDREPGVGVGGVGGPASGAGVLPGAGVGAPGVGVEPRPIDNPGGLGGPASGAGVRPGAGFGAPGAGLYRP